MCSPRSSFPESPVFFVSTSTARAAHVLLLGEVILGKGLSTSWGRSCQTLFLSLLDIPARFAPLGLGEVHSSEELLIFGPEYEVSFTIVAVEGLVFEV